MNTFPKGIYLVIDPTMETDLLIEKTDQALKGGVKVLQIWNHWPDHYDEEVKRAFVGEIVRIADAYNVPVLINNEWKLICDSGLSGVHFDEIPDDIAEIRATVNKPIKIGITCGNDRNKIRSVQKLGIDYISFCAMFPSSSVDTCEIVSTDNVAFARLYTSLPIYVSGGITPENVSSLMGCGADGIAVISGILNSKNPKKAAEAYHKVLNKL